LKHILSDKITPKITTNYCR